MSKIVIVGSGGLAREIRTVIDRINAIEGDKYEFAGYVDNDRTGNDVFGNDEYLCKYSSPIDVVIAVGDTHLRKKLSLLYHKNSFLSFPNIIDPSVIITGKLTLGEGNIICAGTVISTDVNIQNFSLVNMNCTIAHDNDIGDYVTISPGCNIAGFVNVGELSEIGIGTQIIQGTSVGSNVSVWAGSTVIKKITDNCIAFGVPARKIRMKE